MSRRTMAFVAAYLSLTCFALAAQSSTENVIENRYNVDSQGADAVQTRILPPRAPGASGDAAPSAGKPFDWNALIHDLVWPVSALLLAIFLKSGIMHVLSRLSKFKFKEAELEFIGREANESLAGIARGAHLGTLNIDVVFESVKLNEWATLVIARMLMRKGIKNLTGDDHGLGASPSLEKLLEYCLNKKVLPMELISDLQRLRRITYFAEWWDGPPPTKGEWKWAVRHAKILIERLFDEKAIA